jgi:hypothetical protein
MPKLICKCDNVISMGEIPNPNEWLFISDIVYDKFTEGIDSETLYMQMKGMLKCNKCGRLWFFWDGYDNAPSCYKPED